MKATYTIQEAAELTGVHTNTIRRQIKAGHLRAAQIGRVYSISRIELEEWFAKHGGGKLFSNEKEGEEEL